ncbi:threonine ammonia-lyase [Micrococcus luteus]|jgi:threonine dehydratase|uniref:threonine ammonia-lyase n=1 Tax=Micrococcus luteus (strain ATCC 4698 / DSM 20030 / JCM 1464 / CCM 169 / CCUG 5858 / IAM 1056 / NBRC 3333 / NCIMB 9278 / NCTC 2665 / VKM Ac-2230) TaxID=465515 RepID=C5C994_MICLC|nr:threonine ammonia-lyase [Micrococcus luteus]ACS30046.1 L-threonine ammonia-lyase [Micrococcus luteus NCTC 2665]AJO55170.1 threonine dehydratase [Micrococcus luteus]KAB1901070.1 threonine ammonia-lyase [Micrococcus luteus NCTC 2665]ORE58949.1 threonine ammonia-lyase [Micrococcus luteus]QCY44010.1 threonine ammonia-lyase [Micrococcus luteus]
MVAAQATNTPDRTVPTPSPRWVRPAGGAPTPAELPVTLGEIERARETLRGIAERSPLQHSRALSRAVGTDVHLKCENLQRAGSFKVRGAYVRMAQLSEEERGRGVVAASAGNHAQGVALAAAKLGIRARIFMPHGVALPKLQATRDHGAEVVLHGSTVDESLAEAQRWATETDAVFIPPFDDPAVIAGQGTVGLEILDVLPDVDTVIMGIGGGGLIAGTAVALKEAARRRGRTVRVIGVQAATAAAFPGSLEEGRVQVLESVSTIADGIAVGRPGALPLRIAAELVDAVVTVTDDEIAAALVHLLERSKLVVEPAGAVGVAALLAGRTADLGFELGTTAVILSGGNIDPMLMLKSIQAGLSAAGRYMTVRIPLRDRPGELATISRIIADTDANVVRVDHTRVGPELSMGGVHITIDMETRGAEHSAQVLEALRAAGYSPAPLP